MYSFQTVIFPLLMILTVFSIRKDEGNEALSLANSAHLRGIFALCIMIFHISKESDILYPVFYYVSQCVVSAFFFLSGYGLMKGYLNKNNYQKDYLIKRTVKLFLPYLFMIFVYWAYDLATGKTHELSFVLDSILGESTLVMYSWFIKDIIIHYLIFYLLMLVMRDKKGYMTYAAVIMILIDLCLSWRRIENKYLLNTMFCLGMIYTRYETQISRFLKENRKYILLVLLVLAIASRFCFGEKIVLADKILFMLILICALFDRKIENRFLKQAGKMSLEIYMTHGLAKAVVRRYLDMPLFIQDFSIYPVTFILAFLLERLFSFIGKMILDKKKT